MVFNKKCMLTKIENKTSKKGNEYVVVTVLDKDGGNTENCMIKSNKVIDYTRLKLFSDYEFVFDAQYGKFPHLDILDIIF